MDRWPENHSRNWRRRILAGLGAFLTFTLFVADWLEKLHDILEAPSDALTVWEIVRKMISDTSTMAWVFLLVSLICLLVATAEWWLPLVMRSSKSQPPLKPTTRKELIELSRSVAERCVDLGFTPPLATVEPLRAELKTISNWLGGLQPFHQLATEIFTQLSIYADHTTEVEGLKQRLSKIEESWSATGSSRRSVHGTKGVYANTSSGGAKQALRQWPWQRSLCAKPRGNYSRLN